MADLAPIEGVGDDAGDGAAVAQHGVREDPHEADDPAAVDEADPPVDELVAERDGHLGVRRVLARARTAVHAHLAHVDGHRARVAVRSPGGQARWATLSPMAWGRPIVDPGEARLERSVLAGVGAFRWAAL